MLYQADFTGRTVGAIGIFYPIRATVEAADPEAARLKLYDDYEHISRLVLTPNGYQTCKGVTSQAE